MRLSLVIYLPSLGSGGAERLHINLAPALMARGFDVTFLVHRIHGSLVDAVPQGVRLISLECHRTLGALWPLVRFLEREQPHVLVANLGHNNILAIWAAALARVRTRIIATYHNTLSAECAEQRSWQFKALPLMCRLFLGRAHGVVTVSEGVAEDIAAITGLPRDRFTTIYNPVILPDFDARMAEAAEHPWLTDGGPPFILGVGRLAPQKDFKSLLAAFAIASRAGDLRLLLLGEGTSHASLMAHAEALGVADRVSMPGFRPNPLPFMRRAAALVLSSTFEGFGNVLVEALACGTPVVSTDCPHGPAEILDHGRIGRLVPVRDHAAMASAILDTLARPLPSEILRRRGREFSVDRAAILYADLFYRLVFTLPEFADPASANPLPVGYDRRYLA